MAMTYFFPSDDPKTLVIIFMRTPARLEGYLRKNFSSELGKVNKTYPEE
jgi:hypothetical protein